MKVPRLHYYLLKPVLGKSVTKKELRREVGSRSHLSKEAIDVLARDAKDLGVAKQERMFGRLSFSKPKPHKPRRPGNP